MRRRDRRPPEVVTRIGNAGPHARAVVLVHPGALPTAVYADLAAALAPTAALHVVNLEHVPEYFEAALHGGAPATSIPWLAERVADELRRRDLTTGRWCLAGWSFGGVVALELAGLLGPAERPGALLTLDSIAPVPEYTALDGDLDDATVLRWFAMYLGARRGVELPLSEVELPAAGPAPADRDSGLRTVLDLARAHGAVRDDTTLPGLRKVLDTYLQGLVRNNRLAQAYEPRRAPVPVVLVRPDRGLLDGPDPLGWASLTDDLTVLDCPGDHYTMVRDRTAVGRIAGAARDLLGEGAEPARDLPGEGADLAPARGTHPADQRPGTDHETTSTRSERFMDSDDTTARRMADTPIAIVGLGALFPRSRDLGEFWSNVVDAADCIQDVPETHWRIADHYDPDPSAPDKTYAKRGGFVPTVPFNPMEFGLPPNTLEVTDVLQLLSLVVAKQTLADAGAPDAPWYRKERTGVVLGITGANSLTQPLATRLQTPVLKEVVRSCGLSERDAEEISAKFVKAFAPWEEHSFPGMLGNVVAGRIANRFDFGGTNCTVDAACASSLAAVHSAAAELISGRADLMLTGGCDAENTILMYLCFSKTPAFSKAGEIRPFDENADGTLIGEGIGMLALKRLADAERDGDRIYAVLRGIGTSSDGRFKSIYAPRKEGQVVALRRAYEDAGFGPEQVGLVECHGTGTAVGDLTEVSALKEVFAAVTEDREFAAVGSVKSQIGHTKAAAGAAGMIKSSLALYHKLLPPTINVDKPREAMGFDDSPFYVNTKTRPWILEPERPRRRAAVSSFGFGGTNFHCVLEEHDPTGSGLRVLHRTARVYLWHGADPQALLAQVGQHPDGSGDDAVVPAGHARLAVVARDDAERDELRDKACRRIADDPTVESFDLPGGAYYRRAAADTGRVAALFAGQGSQYVAMGAEAAVAVPPVRAAFDAAAAAGHTAAAHTEAVRVTGAEALGRVVFPPLAFDDATRRRQEEVLRRTDHAQPAIGAISTGQFAYLRELGFAAEGALGHSFGELTALWAAGSLTDEQFHTLAKARGVAMATRDGADSDDPGTMAAVSADRPTVERLLDSHPDVVVCNINAPDQLVVGGGTEAVGRFVESCTAAGVDARALPVAAAFHTRYVGHAVDRFGAAVARVTVGRPEIPVYANTDGAGYGADSEANAQVLVRQLANPVSFAPRVTQMYDDGFRVFVEFGPKKVLGGLVRRILADHADVVVLAADAGPGRDSDRALKQLAARLAVLGLPLTGFNRYQAVATTPPRTEGMTIELNGVNYVPEGRRREYQEALRNGYRVEGVSTSAPAPAAPAAAAVAANAAADGHNGNGHNGNGHGGHNGNGHDTNGHAGHNGNGHNGNGNGSVMPHQLVPNVGAIAASHLAMHGDYLHNQLRLSERLTNLVEEGSRRHDGPADNVIAGITAVAEHSLALGQSHASASEVLRSFAQLETALIAPGSGIDYAPVAHPTAMPAYQPPAIGTGPQQYAWNNPAGTGYPPQVDAPTYPPETVEQAAPVSPAVAPVSPAVGAPAPAAAAPAAPAAAAPAAPAAPAADTTAAMDEATVRTTLLTIVSDKTGYPTDMLDPSMGIEADLGIDSIKRVEIMGALRDSFPGSPSASPERLAELHTLDDIVHFVAGAAAEAEVVTSGPKAERLPRIDRWQASLTRLPVPDQQERAYRDDPVALLAGAGGPLADALADALTAAGWRTVHAGEAYDDGLDLVLYLAPERADDTAAATAALREAALLAREVQRPLERVAETSRAAFVTVARLDGRLGVLASDGTAEAADLATVALGGLSGLVKTLAIEAPAVYCRAVDIAAALPVPQVVELLLAELHDAGTSTREVGYDDYGVRWTTRLTAGPAYPGGGELAPPGPEDLLVVTGGGRGVTAACVTDLARRYGVGLLLLGRTPLADEPAWAQGVPQERLKAAIVQALRADGATVTPKDVERRYQELTAQREIRRTLAEASAGGASVTYLPADVTDPAALYAALAEHRDRITGLVHGAGVLADQLIVDKRPEDIDRVLGTKLTGLTGLLAALDTSRLRHVVLFSSVAGFFGNRGQSDYAMANEALNRIASRLRGARPDARITSINWGAWAGGMVTPELARLFTERGVDLIPLDTGVRMFTEQFGTAHSADLVTVIGPDEPLSKAEPRPLPVDGVRVTRELAGLRDEAVLTDHRIDDHPVLPATVALGGILATAAAVTGVPAVGARDFSVLKGVVLDSGQPERLRFLVTPDGSGTRVDVRDDAGRPRYRAVVETAGLGPTPRLTGLPGVDAGEQTTAYADGTLFHGETLRGLRRVLDPGRRMVLLAELPDTPLADGAWSADHYDPALADLLLQAVLVWVRRHTGQASLPTGVGRAELFAPMPTGEPFLIVVDEVTVDAPTVRCTVSACGTDGTVLVRFTGIQAIVRDTGDARSTSHAR
ncbi:SDR family NAD(P)-dependent oxidoreductase [Solwaraspora sp. WMMD406]|uniref:type I polyketide synthase n=1 Tax=Solwaraspora sp. WMMD406 TaxID=3016095 RepID=UPI002416550D|nr:type I polyketide synthase [Solwaraspora sp. WMMD406]MDG4764520.1 SDR family NAD(P)-dependent oxidoreductase [Solwaraspora sp. WMMD406]